MQWNVFLNWKNIWDFLHDLGRFVQFKNMKNIQGEVIVFVKM